MLNVKCQNALINLPEEYLTFGLLLRPWERPLPCLQTKPELIIPADEKATSDTDLDAVDPPPEVSSTQATRFFENAASAAVVASAKTSASAGGNLSADDSGFLSTSPQPQSFVTTSS